MSDKWKVTDKQSGGTDITSAALYAGTGILPIVDLFIGNTPEFKNPDTYTVRSETGDERTVKARDEKELGEKISKGEFESK
jgi:hypothetical protein